MSDDIKEVATLIRLNADARRWPAADALEALHAGLRAARDRGHLPEADALEALVAERDRLKDAIRLIASYGDGAGCNPASFTEIARKALEAEQTDPSPAVCEWTNASGRTVSTCMPGGITGWLWNGRNQQKCPNCLKPIKFMEATE